jgi:hypothetical protein
MEAVRSVTVRIRTKGLERARQALAEAGLLGVDQGFPLFVGREVNRLVMSLGLCH